MSFQLNQIFQEWFNSNSIFMIFIIVGLYAATINYKNNSKIKNIIADIGKNTLGIYLIHYVLLFIKWKYQTPVVTIPMRIVWFISIVTVSYILTKIIKKIPLLNNIIKI